MVTIQSCETHSTLSIIMCEHYQTECALCTACTPSAVMLLRRVLSVNLQGNCRRANVCMWPGRGSLFDRKQKCTSSVVDLRRFIVFIPRKKLKRTPNTPAKCICINSDKTEKRAPALFDISIPFIRNLYIQE